MSRTSSPPPDFMAALRCFRPSSSPGSAALGSERFPPPPSFAPRPPPALSGAALPAGAGIASFPGCPPTTVPVLVRVLAIVLAPKEMLGLVSCCA